MILDNHYAVVFKPAERWQYRPSSERYGKWVEPAAFKQVLKQEGYDTLKRLAAEGHFVILEAWDITKGKCISN